jgi:hypothetical protein
MNLKITDGGAATLTDTDPSAGSTSLVTGRTLSRT